MRRNRIAAILLVTVLTVLLAVGVCAATASVSKCLWAARARNAM